MTQPPTDDDAAGSAAARGEQPELASGDAGVIDRARRRAATFAMLTPTLAVLIVISGWFWPGWFSGATGAVIGGLAVALCFAAAGILLHRAGLWREAQTAASAWSDGWANGGVSVSAVPAGWVKAVCGTGVPLRTGRPVIRVRRERRIGPRVLPLRTAAGYLCDGEAVTVHARPDDAAPGRHDQLQVLVLQPRGPILIGRLDDGVLFAADRFSLGTH